MIISAVLGWIAHAFGYVMGLLPSFGAVDQVSGGLVSAVGLLTGYAADSGAWIPWPAVAVSLLLVSSTLVASLGVKIGLKLLSVFTGGGGSSA